jgi:hypothetical protein
MWGEEMRVTADKERLKSGIQEKLKLEKIRIC